MAPKKVSVRKIYDCVYELDDDGPPEKKDQQISYEFRNELGELIEDKDERAALAVAVFQRVPWVNDGDDAAVVP